MGQSEIKDSIWISGLNYWVPFTMTGYTRGETKLFISSSSASNYSSHPLNVLFPGVLYSTCVPSLWTHLISTASTLPHTHQQPAQGPKDTSKSVYLLFLKTYSALIFQVIEFNLLSTYALRGETSKSPESLASLLLPHEVSHQTVVPHSSSH